MEFLGLTSRRVTPGDRPRRHDGRRRAAAAAERASPRAARDARGARARAAVRRLGRRDVRRRPRRHVVDGATGRSPTSPPRMPPASTWSSSTPATTSPRPSARATPSRSAYAGHDVTRHCRCRPSSEQDAEFGQELFATRPRPVLRAAQGRAAGARRSPPYAAWVTGMRREESPTRADIRVVELGRQARQGQGQPDRRLDPGRRRRLHRSAHGVLVNPLLQDGYAVDRLRAVHPRGRAGRGPARRPLGRPGQDRVRSAHVSAARPDVRDEAIVVHRRSWWSEEPAERAAPGR